MSPEIAFHRYFQRPEVEARFHYAGRQDLEELDAELADDMRSVQQHLNAGLTVNCERALVGGRHPIVHCDYIEPSPRSRQVLGAHAFHDGEYYFVGLTTPLVIRISECAGYLAHSPHIRRLFNIPFGDGFERDQLRGASLYRLFFGHELNFVFGHELGHHVLGHTLDEEDGRWTEFAFDDSHPGALIPLRSQAMEIQADKYAAQYLLTALFKSDIHDASLRLLGRVPSDVEARELLIGIYLASLSGILFALPDPLFTEERLQSEHPLKAARLNNLTSTLISFLGSAAPDLQHWLTLEKFQTFVRCVELSLAPESGSWASQTSYLLSGPGADYYESLIQELIRLDREPNSSRWVFPNQDFQLSA